jgi:hypothetical protein
MAQSDDISLYIYKTCRFIYIVKYHHFGLICRRIPLARGLKNKNDKHTGYVYEASILTICKNI